jgi:hypothetical protein
MRTIPGVCCAVCQQQRPVPSAWFHVIENRWTDRLKIFRCQEGLGDQTGAYGVCCAAHVLELVVHWMTVGRLDVPFASLPHHPRRLLSRHRKEEPRPSPERSLPTSALLGELAVHRESLNRVLRENPQALAPVLQALLEVIVWKAANRRLKSRSMYQIRQWFAPLSC